MTRNWVATIARNGLEFTKAAILSFLDQDVSPQTEVLLLDNASGPEIREWVTEQGNPRVHLLRFDKQISVAAAWNRLCRIVFEDGSEYVIVGNNDIQIMPWTARMLIEDGGPFVTTRAVVHHHQMLEATPDPSSKWPNPEFSLFLIRKSAFDATGGFEENLKIAYADDNFFHAQLHVAGIEAVSINVPIFHHVNGTLRCAGAEEALAIERQANENRAYFERAWGFRIPPNDGGKYTEFFSKPRPNWKQFQPETWVW